MDSNKDSSIAVFLDAKLEFTLGTTSNKFEAPISVAFGECKLTSLKFSKPEMGISYKVGQVAVSKALPKLVQEPDCGKTYD